MQHRIQQGRMHPHPAQLHPLGNSDFSKDFSSPPPHRRQSLKRRTIPIPMHRQPLISVGDIHRHRTRRRPHRQIRRRFDGVDAQGGLGVQHPARIGPLGARIHRHTPLPRRVGPTDDHLYLHPGTRR